MADKTNLLTWENLKTDETIAKLKTDIDALNKVSSTLDALVKAEQKYKESGDLSGFDNTSFDALINNSIKEAIAKDGDIAAYVQGVVQKATLADFKAINNEVSTLTGGVWKSMEAFITDCYTCLLYTSLYYGVFFVCFSPDGEVCKRCRRRTCKRWKRTCPLSMRI